MPDFMGPRGRPVSAVACLVLLLAGCLPGNKPLPPEEALQRAGQRVGFLLSREEPAIPRPVDPAFSESSTVSFWVSANPVLAPAFVSAEGRAAFASANPRARLDAQYIGAPQVAVQKLVVGLAAHELPDVALVDRYWVPRLAAGGRIVPLDSVLPSGTVDRISAPYREACSLDGRLYALPADGFRTVLYVNTDLVPGEAPGYWAELLRTSRSIAARGVEGFRPVGHLPFTELLWSAGDDLVENGRSALPNAAATETLGFLRQLVEEGLASPFDLEDSGRGFAAFRAGRCGMTVASSALLPETAGLPFPVTVAPVPGRERPVMRGSDDVLVVFNQGELPRREVLAAVLNHAVTAAHSADAAALGSMPWIEGEEAAGPGPLPNDAELRWPPLAAYWPIVEAETLRYVARALRHAAP